MAGHIRTTALNRSPWAAYFILILSICFLTTCSSDDPVEPPPPGDQTIGPAGGTVTAPGGASVTVPPGALAADVVITAESFADPATGPYPTCPVPAFHGGARFGPEGTDFAKPVVITLPTREPLNPGTNYQLFVYDPDNLCWVVAKSVATVAPGGQTFVAEVTHFSVFNGGGAAGGGQARSNITVDLCGDGSPEAICQAYVAYFKQYIAKVGDKGVYDGECKEVCGLKMDVACEINGSYFFLPVRDGEFVGEEVTISDQEDCTESGGRDAMLDALSTIYYRCAQPEMDTTAAPAEIELGGSSTVTTTLTCGEMAFPSQAVQFDRTGFGQIDRHTGTTDGAGQARTTYTNNDQEGEATVTAYYYACAGQTNSGTVYGEAGITTGGSWSGILNVNFDHPIGSSPLDLFSDAVTINFDLSIDDQGNITGSGTGSHSADVTPGGECWLSSLTAPGFAVLVGGTATEETLSFVVYPNPMMPVSFVITCQHGEETQDYPYPMAEGLIEGSILTQDISISTARQDGATDAGSGSRSEGTDLPMHYSYSVTLSKGG
jgi:hypothetical protein